MKYYKKIAMLLILVLTLTAGLMACGNADTTNETEETIAEETAVEDTENTEGFVGCWEGEHPCQDYGEEHRIR